MQLDTGLNKEWDVQLGEWHKVVKVRVLKHKMTEAIGDLSNDVGVAGCSVAFLSGRSSIESEIEACGWWQLDS